MFAFYLIIIVYGIAGHHYPDNDDTPELPELPIEVFNVRKGGYYRFRITNAAMTYPFKVSIDGVSYYRHISDVIIFK